MIMIKEYPVNTIDDESASPNEGNQSFYDFLPSEFGIRDRKKVDLPLIEEGISSCSFISFLCWPIFISLFKLY